MPQPRKSPYNAAIDKAIIDGRASGLDWRKIGISLDLSDDQVRCRHKRLTAPNGAQSSSKSPMIGTPDLEVDEGQESAFVVATYPRDGRVVTVEEAVEKSGLNMKKWKIKHTNVKYFEGQAKKGEGSEAVVIVTPMASVHIQFEPLVITSAEEVVDLIVARIADAAAPLPFKILYGKARPDDLLFEPAIYDLHIGKLGHKKEVGSNYDSNIAITRAEGAVNYWMNELRGRSISKIMFIVGNDMNHSDSPANTTTAGTRMDSDSRWPHMFEKTENFLVQMIRCFMQIAPTEVVSIPGNHDTNTSFAMGRVLAAEFSKEKHVSVDSSCMPRKYKRWGRNLLGFNHGDTCTPQRLRNLMTDEAATDWAETKWHEWHVGDKHNAYLQTIGGCRIRVLPALCGPDFWHSHNGYCGSIPSAEAYLWSKKDGYKGHLAYHAET